MNNDDADWFREGMIRCSEEHKRCWKQWTRLVWAGWGIVALAIVLAAAFLYFGLWAQPLFLVGLAIWFSTEVRQAHNSRAEFCDEWLKTRNLYAQKYEELK